MPSAAGIRKNRPRNHNSEVATVKVQGIQAFGQIRKPLPIVADAGKSNLKRKNIAETVLVETEQAPEYTSSKKRKTGSSQVIPGSTRTIQRKEKNKPIDHVARKRKASEEPATTPPPEHIRPAARDTKRKKTVLQSDHLTNTPTSGARSLLERFAFGASSSSARESSPTPIRYETPPSSPPSLADGETEGSLPKELQDLVNLHSSFLTALSLYYAHNGLTNPADLRNLYPGIERTWKKRRVNVDDVRRILAIGQDENAPEKDLFYLSDYGHNKICVEVSDHALQTQQHRVIDEVARNEAFLCNLSQKWSSCKEIPTIGNPSPTAFISNLPLLPITASTSLADLRPLLAKGQSRLSELKAGAIAAQSRNNSFSHATSTKTIPPASSSSSLASSSIDETATATIPTKTRATSLLDRLAAKAQQQSTLPTPPTPSQLARKRALQRLPEIAPVLQSLAVGGQKHDNGDTTTTEIEEKAEVEVAKEAEYADSAAAIAKETRPLLVQRQVSFTMATVVQVLQGSLRNPIAREEAVACVRLMAEEAMPEWVAIREVGRCVGVVIRGGGNLGRGELEGRVRRLLSQ